jgi:hypothetical protein
VWQRAAFRLRRVEAPPAPAAFRAAGRRLCEGAPRQLGGFSESPVRRRPALQTIESESPDPRARGPRTAAKRTRWRPKRSGQQGSLTATGTREGFGRLQQARREGAPLATCALTRASGIYEPMTVIARCNETALVEDGARVGVVQQEGSWLNTTFFVVVLLESFVLVGGVALVTVEVVAGVVLLVIGSLGAWAAGVLWKRKRALANSPAQGAPSLVFDFQAHVLRDGSGTVLAPLQSVRIYRASQMTSSSRALCVSWASGSVLIARGNPFGDSVGAMEDALRLRGVAVTRRFVSSGATPRRPTPRSWWTIGQRVNGFERLPAAAAVARNGRPREASRHAAVLVRVVRARRAVPHAAVTICTAAGAFGALATRFLDGFAAAE